MWFTSGFRSCQLLFTTSLVSVFFSPPASYVWLSLLMLMPVDAAVAWVFGVPGLWSSWPFVYLSSWWRFLFVSIVFHSFNFIHRLCSCTGICSLVDHIMLSPLDCPSNPVAPHDMTLYIELNFQLYQLWNTHVFTGLPVFSVFPVTLKRCRNSARVTAHSCLTSSSIRFLTKWNNAVLPTSPKQNLCHDALLHNP